MKRVLIRIGFEDEFQPLMLGFETISDMQTAIQIVRASGLTNVFLRKVSSSGIEEWDNL
jgi:hypothetical protein